jgi:hypothetical protein
MNLRSSLDKNIKVNIQFARRRRANSNGHITTSFLRDTKLIRCNKPSLWDLSDDAAFRKLKHNVINLMVQKSRRDDTSVENRLYMHECHIRYEYSRRRLEYSYRRIVVILCLLMLRNIHLFWRARFLHKFAFIF